MLVGKADVDIRELEKRVNDFSALLEYMDSLVPIEFRHIQAIIDNQRYLCALYIRNSKGLPWDVRNEIISNIMMNTSIVGFTNDLIEVQTLFGLVSRDKLEYYKGR